MNVFALLSCLSLRSHFANICPSHDCCFRVLEFACYCECHLTCMHCSATPFNGAMSWMLSLLLGFRIGYNEVCFHLWCFEIMRQCFYYCDVFICLLHVVLEQLYFCCLGMSYKLSQSHGCTMAGRRIPICCSALPRPELTWSFHSHGCLLLWQPCSIPRPITMFSRGCREVLSCAQV